MIRLRRRPRYAPYVCAVISALLLLLSVSLLYMRLSHSQSNRNSHSLYKIPSSLSDILISDSQDENDFIIGRTSTEEDKIDELDIVDEDVKSSSSNDEQLGEDEEPSDAVKVSGFYFDHVSGSIRKALDSKRPIQDWTDENSDFSVGSGLEDPSKAAFGSDDVAMDEEVRRKAGEVVEIEDALLLKVGRRVSPLREGWGDWFDKKGDFLRRDRMFKSNLETLNPLNNPILQDPDGVGVTGLTRGDRIVQKWWLNEFKRVPFLAKKTLSVSENLYQSEKGNHKVRINDDANVDGIVNVTQNDQVMRSSIRRTERRTLKENVSNENEYLIDMTTDESRDIGLSLSSYGNSNTDRNSYQVDQMVGTNNVNSKVQVKSEFLSHIYADGKRWGYYPGLHPRLSFSNFMNTFFRKNKCTMRVFMVWCSPPWMFSVRHQRGLESLLSHHPDACVVIFSETIELDFFKDNLLKDGYKVAVVMPNLDELLKNTSAHIFASVWFEWRKTKFYSTHYSELVRLAALYKYGGIYLDSDIIVLKPITLLKNSVGMEDEVAGTLNGAVMAFRRHSPFIMECLKEFYMTYDDTRLRWNGADLLTRVSKCYLKKVNSSTGKLELKVRPSFSFFPISLQNITRYFSAPSTETEKARQDVLFEKILNESSTFHLWNSFTFALVPEPESIVARLIDRFCVRCFDVL